MKKLVLLFMISLISFVAFGQKPMVGFTVTEIKQRNRLEFGTTQWERINMDEYWTIYTTHPEVDLMSMYFFRWGQTKNVMCSQTTKSDNVAREMLSQIIDTYHNLGENRYLNDNGLVVHYKYEKDLGAHQFMYFNPDGKKIFNN